MRWLLLVLHVVSGLLMEDQGYEYRASPHPLATWQYQGVALDFGGSSSKFLRL